MSAWLHRARWLALAGAAAVLILHAYAYDFVTDDAYISFVFSRNLAEHGQLVFNAGAHPVEGYTNFLWTLILGGLMALGVRPELSSLVLGAACGAGALYFAFSAVDRALERRSWFALVAPWLLACSAGFACWTSGGLETQLFTMLVIAAIDGLVAAAASPWRLRRATIALALASMTRPEGPLVAAVLGTIWLVRKLALWRVDRREVAPAQRRLLPSFAPEANAIAWFLLLWGPWFAWRVWYYGHVFPNTYYVKAAGPWASPELAAQMRDNGLYYVGVWAQQARVWWALAFALGGLVVWKPRTPRFVLAVACGVLALVYLGYAVSVGGDFMGLHRFIMPVFVLVAILVALGLENAATFVAQAGAPRAARAAGAVVAVALIGAFAWDQRALTIAATTWGNFASDRGIDTPAFLMVYTSDRAEIGKQMATCFEPDDFSIVGGAGAQPYYGRMRAVDVFGLVSEEIAHDEPRIRARAGHTKFGSDALLLKYDPTFVFSCYAIHREPKQPQLPCAPFWLAHGYEEITLYVPALREQGQYYTFLAKQSRHFRCPGIVAAGGKPR